MRRKRLLWFAGGIIAVLITLLILNAAFPLPPAKPYSLVIKDRNGKLLHIFLASDGQWRIRTHPEEIPPRLKKILLEKEDRYFYYHPGINPFSIARAFVQNLLSGKRISGASTITMQVARMLEPKERTYLNKISEMFRAVQLETHYSKNKILEMYLSMAPMGGNIEGLASASFIYYQTPPERLNIAQLFDLILIPNDPNDLRPDRYPQKLYAERLRRAEPFIEAGLFTEQDSAIIKRTGSSALRSSPPNFAPHFCLRVKADPNTHDEAITSLDLRIQQKVEALLSNHLRSWKQKGVMNGSILVIDNKTREILAYAGSENFYDNESHGQVDAIKALRSPGSTLKPLLYALQMDRGALTPKTRLLDTPYDAEGFYAENYDGTFSGVVYADEALRRSLNVPMVRLLKNAGVKEFVGFANQAGITSLQAQEERLGLSLILGGCGVTLEELVTAYSCFPNGGNYSKLKYFKSQSSKREKNSVKSVFSSSSAFMVTEILSGINRPDLPNNFESSFNLPKVAFKTGTSYGRHDAWSIGYSSEYTVGVWIGNVTHKGNPALTGATSAAPLLIDIFNTISTTKSKTIIRQPQDVQLRDVCANSGMEPTIRCKHIIEDYYSVRHTQERYCEIDKEYLISPDRKTYYCPSCLASHPYMTATFQDYPPELLSFWNIHKIQYTAIPPHNPACSQVFAGTGPTITSPANAATYFLSSPKQNIILQASSGIDVREHIWYIDDQFLKRENANSKIFISLKSGDHTISCMDEKGRISSVKITVKLL